MKVGTTAYTKYGQEICLFGRRLIERVTDEAPPPLTVLDLGIGRGVTSYAFLELGYKVTGVCLEDMPDILKDKPNYTHIKESILDADLSPADIVWASHIVEHMQNVGLFLDRCKHLTKQWLCIVVPTDPTSLMIDGHLTFWTPAHLIYNLVINGWDCSEAKYYTQGRDIALMVRRKDIELPKLNYDHGDLKKLAPYFPVPIVQRKTNPWLPDRF